MQLVARSNSVNAKQCIEIVCLIDHMNDVQMASIALADERRIDLRVLLSCFLGRLD